ncbi:hypothetical protein [Halalkalibacterium halodurans]|uniref:hypothetical protein n=1 Tax=Halalkalibacterium halodurans TaxID=86665 RepID=UPI0010FD872F|nr:hypothetical protein [Halalkalibacterium halodurans]
MTPFFKLNLGGIKIKRKFIIISCMTITLIAIVYLLYQNRTFPIEENSSIYMIGEDPDQGVEIWTTNTQGDPIMNDTVFEVEQESTIVNVHINHEVNTSREYGIIVLQDFIQSSFQVDGVSYNNLYTFESDPLTENIIPLEIDIFDDSKELIILIIREPHVKEKEFDLEKAVNYELIYGKRHLLKSDLELPSEFVEPDGYVSDEQNEIDIFLSSEKEDLQAIASMTENTTLYLHVGNQGLGISVPYAIVGFMDWKQIEIEGENSVLYIESPVDSSDRAIYEFLIPNVEHDTNLQFVLWRFLFLMRI